MFITCQECNTMFRLDERVLKPTGSKVRCSQCLHTFVAMPPSLQPPLAVEEEPVAVEPFANTMTMTPDKPEAEGHELEGIDLAELDAILEGDAAARDRSADPNPGAEAKDGDSSGEMGELEELDLDFDFDALEPEDADQPAVNSGEPAPVDELDLEMDFELEDESAGRDEQPADLTSPPTGADDVGTPEASLGETGRTKEATLEEDLDRAFAELDLASANKDDRTTEASPIEDTKADDFDLTDFDLDMGSGARDDVSTEDEPELSLAEDSDIALNDTAHTGAGNPATAPSRNEDQGLDLEDLDLIMDDSPDSAAPAQTESELERQLDSSSSKSGDDLDLSDLDAMLDASDESHEKAENTSDHEPELRLDDDPELQPEMEDGAANEQATGEAAEGELEELEFELDSEFEDKADGKMAAVEMDDASQDDEIDLSDIEEMLGSDASAVASRAGGEETGEAFDLSGESDEIDLSEIESAIDQAEEMGSGPHVLEETELELDLDLDAGASQGRRMADELQLEAAADEDEPEIEELDLELELELESAASAADKEKAVADDDELDLSDMADLIDGQGDRAVKTEIVDTGDIELEFQIEEDDQEEPALARAKTAEQMPVMPLEETMETTAAQEAPPSRSRVAGAKQKRSSKSLVALLVLLVLAGAAYGVYYAVMEMGIEIPYASDFLKPKPADPNGTLHLSTLDINSKFIENSQSGRLFVITGKVRNGYSTPRRSIRLRGKLFTKGKVLVKTEFAQSGILIGDQDLATFPIAAIKQRLNRNGTATVQAGQNIPFMLVFSDLPPADQLDEFAVDLVGSSPAK